MPASTKNDGYATAGALPAGASWPMDTLTFRAEFVCSIDSGGMIGGYHCPPGYTCGANIIKGWNDAVMEAVRKNLVFGDADAVGEQLAEAVDLGLDGLTVDLPLNGHNPERVELLGKIALRALG